MLRLKALVKPKTAMETFVASLLCWNPIIAGAFSLLFGGAHDFPRRWAIDTTISELAAIQCFAGVHVFRWLEGAYNRRRGRSSPTRSIGFHFFLGATIMPLALPLGFAAGGLVAHGLGADWESLDFRSYRVGIGLGLVMAALFFFQRSRLEARDAHLAAEAQIRELENRRLQAQLSALTAEMNPHLLFNALNTVASLIHRDPDRAEEVIVQLADLYRGVLRCAGSATHPLEDELRLCDAYLQVEHARFGDRLVRELDIDPSINTQAIRVPVLVLQPFVENAVKHGFSRRARGGKVRVELRMNGKHLDMTVDDDGVGFGESPERGTGKGIANCKERLSLTYGTRASLEVGAREGGGTRVVVSLPMGSEG
jgi:anti-sigma regulatory factor (Ser/Thr protein kinase)